MRFLVFFIVFIYSSLASAKYNVCSITINSDDEIKIFKEYLGTNDFNFIELIPLVKEQRPNNVHWFTDACNRGIKCDILVVSGHFGGLFFGENHNYILPVDIMESHSCVQSCLGLLSQIKEVFLFGCNTLAKKNNDHRTPEQYLQILLDHDMARDMAETVVAARYFQFGLSYYDQMRWIFSDQSSIYGFTSLSPLGKNIRTNLTKYFQSVQKVHGSYASYLNQKDPQQNNEFLNQTIGGSIVEVKSITWKDPKFLQFQNMCRLYQNIDKQTGMEIVKKLIMFDGSWAYSSIKKFIAKNKPFTGKSLNIFNKIQQNSNLKAEFSDLYSQMSPRFPYIRIQFLNFLNFFSWVKPYVYKQNLKLDTLKIVRTATSGSYDFAIALVQDEEINLQDLQLTFEDFDPEFYKNVWSALILEILNVQDYKVHRRLMNTCLSKIRIDPVLCYQILKSLGHLKVKDSLIIQKMREILYMPHAGLVYYAIYGLTYSHVKREEVHQAISQHFNHNSKWIRLQAIRSIGFLKSQNQKVHKDLVTLLKKSKDEEIILEVLTSLYQINLNQSLVKKIIFTKKLHESSNKQIKRLALSF